MKETEHRIIGPNFTAHISVINGKVNAPAKQVLFMTGWNSENVTRRCEKNGWTIEPPLPPPPLPKDDSTNNFQAGINVRDRLSVREITTAVADLLGELYLRHVRDD